MNHVARNIVKRVKLRLNALRHVVFVARMKMTIRSKIKITRLCHVIGWERHLQGERNTVTSSRRGEWYKTLAHWLVVNVLTQ
jgi:hypothetical protein